jgi:hypothetical protein
LTNTFFEGTAADNDKAQRGHSKEKRSDCPLVTLGLVLDGSGFVRGSDLNNDVMMIRELLVTYFCLQR